MPLATPCPTVDFLCPSWSMVAMGCHSVAPMAATEDLLRIARRRRGLPDPELCRVIRERAGLSQAEIATVIGVDRAAVSRWESGERSPRFPYRDASAEVLERLASEVLPGPEAEVVQ